MANQFIGMTEDGKFKYRKENGHVFTSKKKLHKDEEKNEITTADENTSIETLSEGFGKKMQHKSAKEAGELIQDTFKTAMLDIADKDITEQQVNDQTLKIIAKLEQAGILFQVQNNKGIQKKVLLNAEEKLMNEIVVSKNNQEKRLQDATYNANEFASNIYGIDSGRPKWQIMLARGGANVFFMIWFIVSTFTFTPIMFLLTMIGVQVKTTGLKWFFTILIYIALMLLLWVIVVSIAGYDNIPLWPNNPPETV